MNVLSSLKSINAYPVPEETFAEAAIRREIDLESEATKELLTSKEYRLTRADILRWLAGAPNISQSGISYSFTAEERAAFLEEANDIYLEYEDEYAQQTKYGYKGSKL